MRASIALLACATGVLVFATAVGPAAAGVAPHGTVVRGKAAGYGVTPAGGITSLQASFTVPILTCAAHTKQSLFIGVTAGPTETSVDNGAQVRATCRRNGPPMYGIFLTSGRGGTRGTVAAGDDVTVSIAISDTSDTEVQIEDHTTGSSSAGFGDPQPPEAEGFVGNGPAVGGPPSFASPLAFTSVLVNGTNLAALPSQREFQVHRGHTLVRTSLVNQAAFNLKLLRA